MYVSHSECSDVAVCGRKHHYSYIERIQPRETKPHLIHGTICHWTVAAIHQALAVEHATWDDIDDELVTSWLYESAIAAYTVDGTVDVNSVEDAVARMLPSMLIWRAHDTTAGIYRNCKVLDVEAVRFTPIVEEGLEIGIDFKSVIDGIIETPDGVQMLLEYKTWADLRNVGTLTLEDQYRRYLYAYPEAVGCWYIAIKRTLKGKPGIAMRYMGRNEVAQDMAVRRLVGHAEKAQGARRLHARGYPPAPENPGRHCHECDYAELCMLTLEGRTNLAASMKTHAFKHVPAQGRPYRLSASDDELPSLDPPQVPLHI
jgi:hypothetical protein